MFGNLQQPIFQPLVKSNDASTNELIRMLQAPQRINDNDSDAGLNGNHNKDFSQVYNNCLQMNVHWHSGFWNDK